MGWSIATGTPVPLGADSRNGGVNFAVFSAHAERIDLCFFDDGDREIARFTLPERTGDVWHGFVPGAGVGQRYGYRAFGPFAPEEGHRFNPHKLLIDPYARALDRAYTQRETFFSYRRGDPAADLGFDTSDSVAGMPKCVVMGAMLPKPTPHAEIPWRDTVIYELHVRGMTMLADEVPVPFRGRLGGLAAPAIVDHLKALGVTAVELLPVNPIVDEPRLVAQGLRNYWGYNPIAFFAVEPRYMASNGEAEFRALAEIYHAAGIEILLDVVFNHTGEGDELGPTLSFRGLDNATYYRLRADNPRYYVNDSACGNTLNVEHSAVLALILDSLRHWTRLGADGFRFDLGVTLGRERDHFQPGAALFREMAADPLLSRVKLIAEPWDSGPDGYRLGGFPPPWREWNDRYRDTIRRFWRGDGGQVGDLASKLAGSSDVFPARGPLASINFVTAHDGFTLHDLVSYSSKHNAANGEDNRDGTNDNHSWNCGVEGATDAAAIIDLRFRQKRNLLATLLLSQGVPMLNAGDEMSRTQNGNNNAYCQDNISNWLAWEPGARQRTFLRFVRRAAALRARNADLRRSRFFSGLPVDGTKDIVWLHPEGREMGDSDWRDPELRALGCVFGATALLLNAGARDVTFVLSEAQWQRVLDTANEDGAGNTASPPGMVDARSLVLLEIPAAVPT